METIEEMIVDEVYYATKTLRAIRSGFDRLQIRWSDGEWEDVVDHTTTAYNMYYACALFRDGSHIPLPLLLPHVGRDKMEDKYVLQRAVISAAIDIGVLDDAITSCATEVVNAYGDANLPAHAEYECQLLADAKAWLEGRQEAP